MQTILNWLRQALNFEWANSVSPRGSRTVFFVLFIVIGLLVLMIPKAYIYQGVKHPRWWHNLKLWAWGVLSFIFMVYWVF